MLDHNLLFGGVITGENSRRLVCINTHSNNESNFTFTFHNSINIQMFFFPKLYFSIKYLGIVDQYIHLSFLYWWNIEPFFFSVRCSERFYMFSQLNISFNWSKDRTKAKVLTEYKLFNWSKSFNWVKVLTGVRVNWSPKIFNC
jgi:hypothetical protein